MQPLLQITTGAVIGIGVAALFNVSSGVGIFTHASIGAVGAMIGGYAVVVADIGRESSDSITIAAATMLWMLIGAASMLLTLHVVA